MNDDRRIEEAIGEALLEYNAPPATPREDIWAAMQKRRRVVPMPRRRPPVLRWPAVAAAILLLGIGIGRISERGWRADPSPASAVAGIDHREFFQAVAMPVLGRAEILLTGLRTDSEVAPEREDLLARADMLLGDTRLLIDSPAADDPEMRELLLDLELVLARITRYAAGDDGEAEWLRRDLESRTLLPRIRWRLPAGDAPVTL